MLAYIGNFEIDNLLRLEKRRGPGGTWGWWVGDSACGTISFIDSAGRGGLRQMFAMRVSAINVQIPPIQRYEHILNK
jgi:hypothetical protein